MSLSNIALDIGRKRDQVDKPEDVVDIITFIESPWGLNLKLFPVQRVILKAHYGLPLDDNPHGFDLEKPIPQDHPLYSEMIDLDPIPAKNSLEILDRDKIPRWAEIKLISPDGKEYKLVEGRHWHNKGDDFDVLESIAKAINTRASKDFEAEPFPRMDQVLIHSKAFSAYGNRARLEVTTCPGLMVAMPPLEIYRDGYETHGHNFYGGEGGFYKYRVPIRDWRGKNPRVFTEAGYLRYLYDEGRCNIREVIPGQERREMVLSIGRRSGKTLITSCIIAYETYKLLKKGNPQKYYGSSQSNVIQLISIATDKDQAGLLYQEASGHFRGCDYFAPYMANSTQSFANFQTPYDIATYGSYKNNPKAKYSVKVTFRSCVAKGLRGGANLVVALDEVAHFGEAGQSSAEEVYQAVEPSTRTFSPKDPNNPTRPIGENEGRIIMISSPLGKSGLFYKSFRLGFKNNSAAKNMLCVQAPTWEVNPTVPTATFEGSYYKDPRVFATEFGAEFTDRTRGWINEAKDLLACVDPTLKPKKRGPIRAPHFMGLDVALVGDYTAVAIGHLDDQGNVVLDYIDRIRAGEGKYENQERLEFDDVAAWVEELSRRFYIVQGIFDQWAGIPLEQALAKKGLKQMEAVHHTRMLTSQMFQNFKDMMYDRRLVLYDWPIPEDKDKQHCDYIEELLGLQEEVVSKYITLVSAPPGGDRHDDYADALVRMVWVATNHAKKVKTFGRNAKTVRGKKPRRFGYTSDELKARKKLLLGGSHESRQVRKRRVPFKGNFFWDK